MNVNILRLLNDIDSGKVRSIAIIDPDCEEYYIHISDENWKWLVLDCTSIRHKQVRKYVENLDNYESLSTDDVKNHMVTTGFLINRDPEEKTWIDIEYRKINDVGTGK